MAGPIRGLPDAHALHAHALWILHTHVIEAFENSPRIAFLSPEPGSGKSRALEVTAPLVRDPIPVVNVSVAYLFRRISVEEGHPLPAVLLDEADAVFMAKASESSEELRGLLNSGYRRGAYVGRAVIRGKEVSTEEWASFCPVALAGLGDLPDTLMTRAVVVRMRRRSQSEPIEPYRTRQYETEGHSLRDAIARWADVHRPQLEGAWPLLPVGISDRNADVWEPLIAVADAAGGDAWPARARASALFMVDEQSHRPATLGIQLLADIRTAMADHHAVTTRDLLEVLCSMETAPWGTLLKGNRIDGRWIARQLAKFDVSTNNTVRVGSTVAKGYTWAHLADAWSRYLPPEERQPPAPDRDLVAQLEEDEPF